MSYRIQQHVFKSNLDLVPRSHRSKAKFILACLAHFTDDYGENAWPSLATLSEMSICNRKTVTMHLDEMVRVGILTVTEKAGQRKPTTYRVNVDKLSAIPMGGSLDVAGPETPAIQLATLSDPVSPPKQSPAIHPAGHELTYMNVRTERSDAFGDLRTFNRAGVVEAKSDRASMREPGHAEETQAVAGADVAADVSDHRRGAQTSTHSQPDGCAGRDRPVASQAGVQLQQRADQPVTRRDSGAEPTAGGSDTAADAIAAIRATLKGRSRGRAGAGLRHVGSEGRERLFAIALRPVKAETCQKDVDKSGNIPYTVFGG